MGLPLSRASRGVSTRRLEFYESIVYVEMIETCVFLNETTGGLLSQSFGSRSFSHAPNPAFLMLSLTLAVADSNTLNKGRGDGS